MEKQRNTTVDFLRLIMALFIVALHANPFAEYNAFVSYFPSQVLSRLGVPFFAAVAGLYFFRNSDEKKYQKTIVKYVEPYLIWTLIYLTYVTATAVVWGDEQELSLWYVIRTVFLTGFYHLWYMLAVVYTVLILWSLSRYPEMLQCLYRVSFVFLLIGIAMFGYGNLTFRVPMVANTLGTLDTNVNMQTQWLFSVIPFFMMGYGINRKKLNERWDYKHCEVLLCASVVGYFMEVILIQVLDLKQSTTLCLFTYPVVYFLLLISQKHPFMLGGSKGSLYVAGMASFTYFSHILFVLIFQRVGFYETPTYIATVLITGAMGYFTVKSKSMLIKKLI